MLSYMPYIVFHSLFMYLFRILVKTKIRRDRKILTHTALHEIC